MCNLIGSERFLSRSVYDIDLITCITIGIFQAPKLPPEPGLNFPDVHEFNVIVAQTVLY